MEIVKFKSLTKTYTLLVYHEFHFFQYQSERSDRFMSKIYIAEDGSKYILVRYITRNGVRIYPKNAKAIKIKIR